jgi:hypothetical protein
MQAIYSTTDGKYISYPATMLANNLVDFINSNATWEPEGVSTRLYLATQDNGTMLMFSTLQSQNVAGWSLRDTVGKFRQVIGEGRQTHVLTEREVNTSATYENALDSAWLSSPDFGAVYDVQSFFETIPATSSVGVFEAQYDYIVCGNQAPFYRILINFNTPAGTDREITAEYLDNNGQWNVFSVIDNTSGFTTDGSVAWTFDEVQDWAVNDLKGQEKQYFIRLRRTAATDSTTVIGQVRINTVTRIYLERQSFDYVTDSSIAATSNSSGVVTGLGHLAGQQVYAIDNGATIGSSFVDFGGNTTIKNANADVTIGLSYKPLLVPMPIYTPTQNGDNLYSEKYVQDLYIDYVDSLYLQAGFLPQLTDIPNLQIGNYTLGSYVQPQTGVYHVCPRGSWDSRQQFVITQSQPGKMTIIGVGYNVEVA